MLISDTAAAAAADDDDEPVSLHLHQNSTRHSLSPVTAAATALTHRVVQRPTPRHSPSRLTVPPP